MTYTVGLHGQGAIIMALYTEFFGSKPFAAGALGVAAVFLPCCALIQALTSAGGCELSVLSVGVAMVRAIHRTNTTMTLTFQT